MLLFLSGRILPEVFIISSVGIFIINNKLLSILVAILLLSVFLFYRFFRRRKLKKKREQQEVIPPITTLLPYDEQLNQLNDDLKPFGFAYDPYQDIFYSLLNCWQREVGYCRLYDEATAPLSMIIDCEPIRFEYAGKRWMIEFWKGQYGMTTGGEIGIYYTSGPDINIPGLFNGTFYHCVKDQDRINMSFVLRKNGNILFTRSDYHWWLTGFKLGEFSYPSELTMDIALDLYDHQMRDAFIEALRKAGYTKDEYYVKGRRVYVNFTTPHTAQPLTRTHFTVSIMQRNNEAFCNAYKELTKDYLETIDKLAVVRNYAPNMYSRILNPGKSSQVFSTFNRLKYFLSDPKDHGEE
ncbi:MAG: DUF4474 domain-containing protein [Clostridiales bacterium]|nr:DUF4474 domain-containing protein [Clostridiales bacterium]